jgi:ferredoxin
MATENTHTDDHDDRTTTYRVTIDKERCDGIFACLVRDVRFVEGEDGLATIDPKSARAIDEGNETITAEFEDDEISEAKQAAAACPPSAISIEELEGR